MEPSSVPTPSQAKPQKVQTIGILMIISGIANLLFGLGLAIGLALSIILLCCAPLGLLPVALAIFEFIYGIRLVGSSTEPTRHSTLQVIAVLEIVAIMAGNFISLVIGIVNLVLLNDPEVKAVIQ
jgi:hypothetical protein